MSTSKRARRDAGFTLVEILIALVILSVGLLALEAMGIGAMRLVNKAQRQTALTQIATSQLEESVVRLRNGWAVTQGTVPVSGGTMRTQLAPLGGGVTQVSVTVIPDADRGMISANDSIRLSANVFNPPAAPVAP
ncbi:MAG TPA: prepilin-type N-terminal cleavage/methylation domain-containing protein [Longimicrobium sp.]|nr:prepilin-type N-terminal cleavage/methylation domain-containing protein [Longimicrobium sp.]